MKTACIAVSLAFALCACTTLEEIRTRHESSPQLDRASTEGPCTYDAVTPDDRRYSIEEYGDRWAAFVEFDDEGWTYRGTGRTSQTDAFEARLQRDLDDPQLRDHDFLVVAFVHGWHHNAHDSDCNVHDFRTMLRVASERYAQAYDAGLFRKPRRIIGVYVGWRGESLNHDGFRYTTVIDRRNAAERVAKGDVRELFAVLRRAQIGAARDSGDDSRMRTVVIGHSFGGLIAFNGLSPAILNELTLTRPRPPDCRPVLQRQVLGNGSASAPLGESTTRRHDPPVFPDLLVLVNPAFEATRFESIHAQGVANDGCPFLGYRPKVVVVTSETDRWTGNVFTVGRSVLTLLEAYPPSDTAALERDANLHAIGNTKRYVTHRLTLDKAAGRAMATRASSFAGGGPPDPCTPVWVVSAADEIISGHDGFLFPMEKSKDDRGTPYLLYWLATLHASWSHKEQFMTGARDETCPAPPPAGG